MVFLPCRWSGTWRAFRIPGATKGGVFMAPKRSPLQQRSKVGRQTKLKTRLKAF